MPIKRLWRTFLLFLYRKIKRLPKVSEVLRSGSKSFVSYKKPSVKQTLLFQNEVGLDKKNCWKETGLIIERIGIFCYLGVFVELRSFCYLGSFEVRVGSFRRSCVETESFLLIKLEPRLAIQRFSLKVKNWGELFEMFFKLRSSSSLCITISIYFEDCWRSVLIFFAVSVPQQFLHSFNLKANESSGHLIILPEISFLQMDKWSSPKTLRKRNEVSFF